MGHGQGRSLPEGEGSLGHVQAVLQQRSAQPPETEEQVTLAKFPLPLTDFFTQAGWPRNPRRAQIEGLQERLGGQREAGSERQGQGEGQEGR